MSSNRQVPVQWLALKNCFSCMGTGIARQMVAHGDVIRAVCNCVEVAAAIAPNTTDTIAFVGTPPTGGPHANPIEAKITQVLALLKECELALYAARADLQCAWEALKR